MASGKKELNYYRIQCWLIVSCLDILFKEMHLKVLTILLWTPRFHGDVIKWKQFPRCIYERNSLVTGEIPSQRPVMRSFDVFFDLCLNNQSRRRWFETPSLPLWRHCNAYYDRRGHMKARDGEWWRIKGIIVQYSIIVTSRERHSVPNQWEPD